MAPHCSRACLAAAPNRVEKVARNSASLSVDDDDDDDEAEDVLFGDLD